jgi:hypothetical protein
MAFLHDHINLSALNLVSIQQNLLSSSQSQLLLLLLLSSPTVESPPHNLLLLVGVKGALAATAVEASTE